MNTIQQTITIPADRRLQLELTLPENIPAGLAEMLVVLSPVGQDQHQRNGKSILHLAGRLADSPLLAADPAVLQKTLRDEW